MTEADLYRYLAGCRLGVLGTVGESGPQGALMGIAVTPELEIVFDTVSSSRKFGNLSVRPECSFVMGLDGLWTAQYEGEARLLVSPELERYREIYFAAFPDGPGRLNWPGISYFAVRPKWIRFCDYGQKPPSIREFRFPAL